MDTDLANESPFKVALCPLTRAHHFLSIFLFCGRKCSELICTFLAPDLESSTSVRAPGSRKNGIQKPRSEPRSYCCF